MYYELYIDIFFLVNFMMDYLLLLLVKRILKCSATHGNICSASFAGSLLTCGVTVLPFDSFFIKFIFFHAVINLLMLRIGFRLKKGSELLRGFAALYTGGFLLGGIFTFLHQYIRAGSLFFGIAVLSYHIVQCIWSFVIRLQRFTSYRCKATLYFGEGECIVEAVIDTGNSLRDPVTGKPVCVLEEEKIHKFIDKETFINLRRIPFRSVGQSMGELPIIQLEKMCVHKEKEYWIDHPVIGICAERISGSGGYGMIMNPDILDVR